MQLSPEVIKNIRALTVAAALSVPFAGCTEIPVQPTPTVKPSSLTETRPPKNQTTYVEHGSLKEVNLLFGEYEDIALEQLGYWIKNSLARYGMVMIENQSKYAKHFSGGVAERRFNGLEVTLVGYTGRKDEVIFAITNIYDEEGKFAGNTMHFEFSSNLEMPEIEAYLPKQTPVFKPVEKDSATKLANLIFNNIPEDIVWKEEPFALGPFAIVPALQTTFKVEGGQATIRIGADRSVVFTYLVD